MYMLCYPKPSDLPMSRLINS